MPYKSNREILLIYITLRILFDVYKQHYLRHTRLLLLFSSNHMNIWRNSQLNYMVTYFYHLTTNLSYFVIHDVVLLCNLGFIVQIKLFQFIKTPKLKAKL